MLSKYISDIMTSITVTESVCTLPLYGQVLVILHSSIPPGLLGGPPGSRDSLHLEPSSHLCVADSFLLLSSPPTLSHALF